MRKETQDVITHHKFDIQGIHLDSHLDVEFKKIPTAKQQTGGSGN